MYVCVTCAHEMYCHKNSVGADFGQGHIYPADRFRCPVCGTMILATNSTPSYDLHHKFQDEYLTMKGVAPL